MKLLDTIVAYINNLDKKNFFRISAWALGILVLASSYIAYRHINSLTMLARQARKANNLRDRVRLALEEDERVERKQKEVDTILDKSFKIAQYLTDLLEKTGLKDATGAIRTTETPNEVDKNYRDIIAATTFNRISMKQLTELLQTIEQNERVYIRELEISQKQPNTIDVTLTIATLSKRG